ncbi:hypothetical protein LEP1GSC047_0974 [Leptospira inadai serovar Lyme str. 10]|uniref:Uncharacterized protein n=2 Tax=Leptospira inadai serovar Lyme TaxID=293084 RepID=V6H8W8_9LEPT|nr:hypothetical protein [Leptospira inadai]EQA35287.1 hypothetical protein LEP1GSC047_0974 [Leptospira inadai serovar Lyme str. 10]PNV74195.1 family 2 glycosyl transferase [Leptospira inadai serovar Lyme]
MQDNIELFVRRLPHIFFILFSIPILFYLYTGYKERKELKFFIAWQSIVSYIFIACGFVLIVLSSYLSIDDILTIFRELTTLFAFIYGVFATIHDFHEKDNETGKRVVTNVGKIGVMVLTVNILLSMSTDYVNQALANIDKDHLDSKIKILEQEYITQTGEIKGDTSLLLSNYQQYIELSHRKVGELEAEIERLRTESQNTAQVLKETQGRLAQSLQENQERVKELETVNVQLTSKTQDAAVFASKFSDASQKVEDRQKTITQLNSDLQSKTIEIASLTERGNACNVDLVASRKNVTDLNGQIQTKIGDINTCNGKLSESSKMITELKKNMNDVNLSLNSKINDWNTCASQLAELKAQISEKNKSLSDSVSLANQRGIDLRNCRATVDKEVGGITQRLSGIEDFLKTKTANQERKPGTP